MKVLHVLDPSPSFLAFKKGFLVIFFVWAFLLLCLFGFFLFVFYLSGSRMEDFCYGENNERIMPVQRLLSKLLGLWLPQIQTPYNSGRDIQNFDIEFSIYVTRVLDLVWRDTKMFTGFSYLSNVSSDRKGKCHGICNLSVASRHAV